MKTKNIQHFVCLVACIFTVGLFFACKKEKEDVTIDAPLPEYELSKARMVMFNQYYKHVVANGRAVTNIIRPYDGSDYFPDRGMYGGIFKAPVWAIPQQIYEEARIDFHMTDDNNGSVNFSVQEAPDKYLDHYVIPPIIAFDKEAEIVTVERNITSPSKPDHFKVRLLNLTRQLGSGSIPEDLSGPLTLVYADGTAVSTQTTNVTPDQQSSGYIELPYGTYQFKILTADGRQVSGANIDNTNGDNLNVSIDAATSRVNTQSGAGSALLTYAPIKTYQPGGVYTLVVCPIQFSFLQNGFVRIVDNIVPLNETYGRVQAINGIPGQQVSFRVRGANLASGVGFGEASDYQIVEAGDYTVEAMDASGKVIASATSRLDAGANHSVWLYPGTSGGPELVIVANDLSGEVYIQRNDDDASYNKRVYDMPLAFRFLNLSPDFEKVSFTMDEGKSLLDQNPFSLQYHAYSYAKNDRAVYNLVTGKPTMEFPYVYFNFHSTTPFDILTFRSEENTVPGVWASDVAIFRSAGFVNNEELYSRVGRTVPTYECGYYTLALIGKTGDNVSATDKARILKVKHNK